MYLVTFQYIFKPEWILCHPHPCQTHGKPPWTPPPAASGDQLDFGHEDIGDNIDDFDFDDFYIGEDDIGWWRYWWNLF